MIKTSTKTCFQLESLLFGCQTCPWQGWGKTRSIPTGSRSPPTADEQEEHGDKHQKQVNNLRFEVLLVEDHRTEQETDNYGTTAHHRDNGNHGTLKAEGIEVSKVGCREEQRDEDDAPVPSEWRGLLVGGPPEEEEHQEHHEKLVDIVPRLHGEFVQPHTAISWRCHEKLVIQSGDSPQHVGEHHEDDPFVMLEVDTLLFAGA